MIKYFVIVFVIFLTGCSKEYIYIKPEYPKLVAPRKVPSIEDAFVRNGCLWIKDHNTNLCNGDLKIVLGQIKKLRINEQACEKKIESYNEFVERKKQKTEQK